MLEQLIGQSLDRYQIVELLGEGGMGAVFRARDVALQRDVALKVMQEQAARLPGFKERFLQEARAAARLDHPGIVKVFDFGQSQSLLYIVMEFIRGDNLRRLLDELQAAGKTLSLAEAVQLAHQICLALDYAHQQGILHRDIKPDNIMLKPQPVEGLPYRPVLTDLGLAKLMEGGMLTVEGTSMGTPSYMSPEQAMGEPTDVRSDVYSLGVLLYELAVGRLPFPIKTLTEAIRYHTKEPPPPPRSIRPDLPEPLAQVIVKALAKAPAERFQSAGDLAVALEAVLPAVTSTGPEATVVAGGDLKTVYEDSASRARGNSILAEFPEAAGDLSRDRISILLPDGTVRPVSVTATEFTIGRDAGNAIVLDLPSVSRQHARVRFDGEDYQVVDLNSTNGTFLGNIRLLPGVPEPWLPEKALRIGDAWLRLEPSQSAAGGGTIASSAGGAQSTRVAAFLQSAELAVDPGGSVAGAVTVLNQGPVVDHFRVWVDGLPEGWVPVQPPLIRLLPGAQQEVSLVIRPPRTPQSRAGSRPFTIRVASQDAPGQVVEVRARLTVRPYAQMRAELKPRSVQAGKTAHVEIANQGNAPETYTATLEDPAEELIFLPAQAMLKVPEGQTGAAKFQATLRNRRWVGGSKAHAYTAHVAPAGGEAQAVSGEVVSKGLIPTWLPPLVLIPLIALCVLLIGFIRRPPVIAGVTFDPASPVAGAPVTVRWSVENATLVELRPLVDAMDAAVGEYTFADGLPADTSLTFVARNRFGSAEQPLTIGVLQPTPTPTPRPEEIVIEEWSVSPETVTKGQPVTIRWRVRNAESVTLEPFGTVESAGEMEHVPQQTTRYVLTAVGQGQPVEKAQEVVVEPAPPDAPVINAFTAEPGTVILGTGGTVRLSWDTQNTDSVAIEPGIGPVGPVGYRDLPAPDGDTLYTLVAKNAGGEVRAQAQVQVIAPTPIPTLVPTDVPTVASTPTLTPTPGPTWRHDVTLLSNRTIFHLRLTGAGQIKVRATWTGSQSQLAIMINGPGQQGAYARQDGGSGLETTYNVTEADYAQGDEWRVTLASFGTGTASGSVQITYPSGSSISPFADNFAVKPDYARSTSVIVLHRLGNLPGSIKAEATWAGSPTNLGLFLNGPQNMLAHQDGSSPLRATFEASDADLDKGDTWRVTLAGAGTINTQGAIDIYYPNVRLIRISPVVPIQP